MAPLAEFRTFLPVSRTSLINLHAVESATLTSVVLTSGRRVAIAPKYQAQMRARLIACGILAPAQ